MKRKTRDILHSIAIGLLFGAIIVITIIVGITLVDWQFSDSTYKETNTSGIWFWFNFLVPPIVAILFLLGVIALIKHSCSVTFGE